VGSAAELVVTTITFGDLIDHLPPKYAARGCPTVAVFRAADRILRLLVLGRHWHDRHQLI
jgi:hypothetical protein